MLEFSVGEVLPQDSFSVPCKCQVPPLSSVALIPLTTVHTASTIPGYSLNSVHNFKLTHIPFHTKLHVFKSIILLVWL